MELLVCFFFFFFFFLLSKRCLDQSCFRKYSSECTWLRISTQRSPIYARGLVTVLIKFQKRNTFVKCVYESRIHSRIERQRTPGELLGIETIEDEGNVRVEKEQTMQRNEDKASDRSSTRSNFALIRKSSEFNPSQSDSSRLVPRISKSCQ